MPSVSFSTSMLLAHLKAQSTALLNLGTQPLMTVLRRIGMAAYG